MTARTGDSLHWLEEAPVARLDEAVWRESLAALRAYDEALAARLERLELPASWRPVTAIDGAPTWRLETSGAPAEWLGGTAAPRTRADGLFGACEQHERNVALPAAGTGAEIETLLERLPQTSAVFVFEPDLTRVAAVLRICAACASHRCIFMGPDEEAGLRRILTARPGLMPPIQILRLPEAGEERIEALKALIERIGREIVAQRRENVRAALAAATTSPGAAHGFAFVALKDDSPVQQAALGLTQAAGRDARAFLKREPNDVDATGRILALADQRPEWCVLLDDAPVLQIAGVRWARWHLRGAGPLDADVHFAGTPQILEKLNAAGVAAELLPWGVTELDADAKSPDSDAILLIADLPQRDEDACGVEQPTHRQLWQRLAVEAQRAWEGNGRLDAGALLAAAERSSGIRLDDPKLRAWMLELIGQRLVPALVAEQCAQALVERGALKIVGAGWDSRTPGGAVWLAAAVYAPDVAAFTGNVSVCIALAEAQAPQLLQAAALAGDLLSFSGRTAAHVTLAPVLNAQDILPFTSAAELRQQLARAGTAAAAGRAQERRARLRREHGYAARFAHLQARLRALE